MSEFKPIPVPADPGERDKVIDHMAGNIVKSYVASAKDRQTSIQGERFYSGDAFGAAHAISQGRDPNGRVGRLYRRPPVGAKGTPEENVAKLRPGDQPGIHRAAGVIARLSPQTGWERNVRQAHEAYGMSSNATQALAHLRGDARDTSRKPGKNGQYPRYEVRDDSGRKLDLNRQPSDNILRAVDIAEGRAEPEQHVATGPGSRVKIGSFFHNVEHPETSPHTTVDFRHHDIAYGQLQDTSVSREISKSGTPPAPGKPPGKAYQQKMRYDMVEEATNRATDRINAEHPDLRVQPAPLQAKQVQAVAWWGDKKDVDRRLGGDAGVAMGGHLHAGAAGKPLKRSDLGKPLGQ